MNEISNITITPTNYSNNTICTSSSSSYIGYSNIDSWITCTIAPSAISVNMTLEEFKEYIHYRDLKEAAKYLNKDIWEFFWFCQ